MRIFDKRLGIALCFTMLFLVGMLLFNIKESYAAPVLGVPEITSFEKSELEDNALQLDYKTNNTGTDFSIEAINGTTKVTNNLAGSVTRYTYQNLEEGKEYKVQVRACTNSETEYVCSDWSKVSTAIAGFKPVGIKSIKLSTTKYVYNGKAKTPSVTVVDDNGNNLVKNTDYTVTLPSKRTAIGEYKVTVKGQGNYDFTKKLSFVINPPKTSISKVTATKNSITVKYKKASGGIKYQVGYKKSSDKDYKYLSGVSATSRKIAGLSAGTSYKVVVRCIKQVNGTVYKGTNSAVKSIKTKASTTSTTKKSTTTKSTTAKSKNTAGTTGSNGSGNSKKCTSKQYKCNGNCISKTKLCSGKCTGGYLRCGSKCVKKGTKCSLGNCKSGYKRYKDNKGNSYCVKNNTYCQKVYGSSYKWSGSGCVKKGKNGSTKSTTGCKNNVRCSGGKVTYKKGNGTCGCECPSSRPFSPGGNGCYTKSWATSYCKKQGKKYNASKKACVATSKSCGRDEFYHSGLKKCVGSRYCQIHYGTGSVYSSGRGKCVCSTGYTWSGGKCVKKVSCSFYKSRTFRPQYGQRCTSQVTTCSSGNKGKYKRVKSGAMCVEYVCKCK